MKYTKTEQSGAMEQMHKWLKPGDTVHTILRHVSRSGMQREIGLVVQGTWEDGTPRMVHPNQNAAILLGERVGKRDGIIVGGCGMDMGFEIVYTLGRKMFPDGFDCIGEKCRSNDHSNGMKREGCKARHKDGGYALRQEWL